MNQSIKEKYKTIQQNPIEAYKCQHTQTDSITHTYMYAFTIVYACESDMYDIPVTFELRKKKKKIEWIFREREREKELSFELVSGIVAVVLVGESKPKYHER